MLKTMGTMFPQVHQCIMETGREDGETAMGGQA